MERVRLVVNVYPFLPDLLQVLGDGAAFGPPVLYSGLRLPHCRAALGADGFVAVASEPGEDAALWAFGWGVTHAGPAA